MLSPTTEVWLRERYANEMSAEEVRRDLGEILTHGEPGGAAGKARSPRNRRAIRPIWDEPPRIERRTHGSNGGETSHHR